MYDVQIEFFRLRKTFGLYAFDQTEQIRQMTRQFARAELAPIAQGDDEERAFPWEAVEKMGPLIFSACRPRS